MKKLLLLLSILILSGCDGTIDPSSTDLFQPDFYYEIDGWGTNPDVYEFTPKSNTNYSCIIVIENVKGVFCFPKQDK